MSTTLCNDVFLGKKVRLLAANSNKLSENTVVVVYPYLLMTAEVMTQSDTSLLNDSLITVFISWRDWMLLHQLQFELLDPPRWEAGNSTLDKTTQQLCRHIYLQGIRGCLSGHELSSRHTGRLLVIRHTSLKEQWERKQSSSATCNRVRAVNRSQ